MVTIEWYNLQNHNQVKCQLSARIDFKLSHWISSLPFPPFCKTVLFCFMPIKLVHVTASKRQITNSLHLRSSPNLLRHEKIVFRLAYYRIEKLWWTSTLNSYQNLNDIKSDFFAPKIFKLVFVWIIIETLLLLLIIEKIDSDQSRNNHQIEIYQIFRALMMQKNVAVQWNVMMPIFQWYSQQFALTP